MLVSTLFEPGLRGVMGFLDKADVSMVVATCLGVAAAASQMPVVQFKELIAAGGIVRTLRAINIQKPWARLILEGYKTIEARKYDLKGYKGEDLWVIETKEAGSKRRKHRAAEHETCIIGIVRFGDAIEYTDLKQWKCDTVRHRISGGAFQWNPRKCKMFGWRISKAQMLAYRQPQPEVKGMVGSRAIPRVVVLSKFPTVPPARRWRRGLLKHSTTSIV